MEQVLFLQIALLFFLRAEATAEPQAVTAVAVLHKPFLIPLDTPVEMEDYITEAWELVEAGALPVTMETVEMAEILLGTVQHIYLEESAVAVAEEAEPGLQMQVTEVV